MTAQHDGQVLADWYRDEVEQEIRRTVPKAIEYGSGDLMEIGRAMGRVMGRTGLDEEEATELGCFFYALGKLARWEQAIKDNRRASDDTLFDLRVYLGMAIRNRQVGGWPWASEPETKSLAEQVRQYCWTARKVHWPTLVVQLGWAETTWEAVEKTRDGRFRVDGQVIAWGAHVDDGLILGRLLTAEPDPDGLAYQPVRVVREVDKTTADQHLYTGRTM